MPDFKTVPLKPLTGIFDTLSSADEIGFGNWHVVKNATTRSTRNRQRGGGWRRLFADDLPYNNQDLHDQLTDQLGYFEEFSAHAMGGGGLSGYGFPYFFPSYTVDGGVTVGPQSGPYCPVYVGDFPSGIYNGCSISDAFVGYPFREVSASVDTTFLRSHWRMDEATGNANRVDAVGGIDLTALGSPVGVAGKINGAVEGTVTAQSLSSTHVDLRGDDIKFGFTGWLQFNNVTSGNIVLGCWNTTGGQASYKVFLTGSSLSFQVTPNGAIVPPHVITSSRVLVAGQSYFFAVWHDSVANTINVKINADTTTSASYSLGVFAGTEQFLALRGTSGGFAVSPMDGWLDEVNFWRGGFPSEAELASLYNGGDGDTPPFASGEVCNTGYPNYFAYSHLYTQCSFNNPDFDYSGYGYGPAFAVYDPAFSYDYTYCGTYLFSLLGCREAVTMLQEVVTYNGRKLIASTMSRLYELNQSAGNWRILADGLGNSGYTINQCGCNKFRGVSATLGSYLLYTNNFDPPLIYLLGDDAGGCGQQAAQPVTDLVALGITKAGGVVTWKGFTILFDFTEDGVRMGGSVIWSDLEDPNSFIESDTSHAGRSTIAVGETLLAAAELGNWLMFYTDMGIIRATLVGGEDVFNFERVYTGGNALKYKFSLINCGDQHLYLGESDVYAFTQFDTRPVNMGWITKAAGMIFNGIAETDATYLPINKDACDLVTGGWSDEKHEAWLSWPTGENICPDVTLRFNLKFNTADFVDHGFTAMMTFRADDRPTVGQWIEDMGICPRGSQVATGRKDGAVCTGLDVAVANPPLYIRNPEEDPDLPVHPDSLCIRLIGLTIEDFCVDCASESTFITASATDFTLKEQQDDVFYRQMLGGSPGDYDAYACQGEFYINEGYASVMQSGAQNFRNEDEKLVKMIGLEAEPVPQAVPLDLEMEVGYASQSSCMAWVAIRPLPFECRTNKTPERHLADHTRPDFTFYYPCWRRGRFLAARFRINGIGGAGTFSSVFQMIKGWGQADSP